MSQTTPNATGGAASSGSGSGATASSGSGSKSGINCRSGNVVDAKKAMEVQNIGPFEQHGGCKLKLVNVTATADMRCTIDLKNVVTRARNAQYNPKRFSACIIRMITKGKPTATALVFKTGKVVVTGAKSDDAVDYVCAGFARILDKVGGASQKITFDPTKHVTVQNMVATTDVGFPIRLEGLHTTHGRFCNYEPELFPGLIFRMLKPKICVLVFVSGKVVLTGAKSAKQLEEAFKNMYPVLVGVKKETVLLQAPSTPHPKHASKDLSKKSSTEHARKKRKT